MRGEFVGVLPGRTREWREFDGLAFDFVLREALAAAVVELFETRSTDRTGPLAVPVSMRLSLLLARPGNAGETCVDRARLYRVPSRVDQMGCGLPGTCLSLAFNLCLALQCQFSDSMAKVLPTAVITHSQSLRSTPQATPCLDLGLLLRAIRALRPSHRLCPAARGPNRALFTCCGTKYLVSNQATQTTGQVVLLGTELLRRPPSTVHRYTEYKVHGWQCASSAFLHDDRHSDSDSMIVSEARMLLTKPHLWSRTHPC